MNPIKFYIETKFNMLVILINAKHQPTDRDFE